MHTWYICITILWCIAWSTLGPKTWPKRRKVCVRARQKLWACRKRFVIAFGAGLGTRGIACRECVSAIKPNTRKTIWYTSLSPFNFPEQYPPPGSLRRQPFLATRLVHIIGAIIVAALGIVCLLSINYTVIFFPKYTSLPSHWPSWFIVLKRY